MNLRAILIFIVIFSLWGCKQISEERNQIIINNFEKVVSLKSNSIKSVENDISPFSITLVDSLAIFCDTENEPHFHVYKLPNFEFISKFGNQGFGPGDINRPIVWDQVVNSHNSKLLWVYQLDRMRFTLIDIQKSINKNKIHEVKSILLPPEINTAVNIIMLNNKIIIGTGVEAPGEFFIYDPEKDVLKWKEFQRNFDETVNNRLLEHNLISEYNRGIIKVKPDGKKFIKVFLFQPYIDIYNENAEIEKSFVYNDFHNLKFDNNYFAGNTRCYFLNACLTDELIFIINLNCTLTDFFQNNCNDVFVDVFNWNGNQICRFKLNEGISAIGAFAVDYNNLKLYTINPKNEFDYYSSFNIDTLKYFR